MKKLLVLLLLCFSVRAVLAAATFTATFTPGAVTWTDGEFAVEEKKTATLWVEVAKGTASPIQWSISTLAPGTYTFRVYARSRSTPTSRSPNSDEVTVVVAADRPTDFKITVVTVVTATTGSSNTSPSP